MDPKTGKVADYDPNSAPELKQQGIADTTVGDKEQKEPQKTPQFLAREEMAKRAQQRRMAEAEDFKYDEITDDGALVEAKETPKEAAPEEKPDPESFLEDEEVKGEPKEPEKVEAAPEPKEEPAQEEERELIVDGKRIKVPLSKIVDAGVRTLQKETAADMKLAAASQLERQLQERMAQMQPPREGADERRAAPQAREQLSDEDAVSIAKAIQFGTEAEAASAIRKMPHGATPEQIAAFVQNTLSSALPNHIAFQSANDWVRSEYKEVFSDPDMAALFMQKESQARQGGDTRSYRDLYKDLADGLVTKFKLRPAEAKAPAAKPLDTTSAQDRITRKAQAPKVVSGASGRAAAPEAPKQLTVSQYVERQRQMRGLQPIRKEM